MIRVLETQNHVLTRTRVLRGCSGEVPWELWQRTPHAQLAGWVLELWAGAGGGASDRHRILPNGEVTLMLHLSAPQRWVERDGVPHDELLSRGFVAGLQERPICFESIEPATRVVAARLTPAGGRLLLGGVPQVELAHRVFEAEAVLDARSGIAELRERMLHAAPLGAVLDLLERWLLQRSRSAHAAPAATREASARLSAAHGAMPVTEVARHCGVSPRRLHELFVNEIGVSPKRLARVLRFRRALEHLARSPAMDLRGLALECGYYDQSHLYRDFRALAQMTPVDYRAAVGDGLDGADVLAN